MQYLLTEEEFRSLNSREAPSNTALRIHDAEQAFEILQVHVNCWKLRGRGYCDDCPLQKLRTICTGYREYSK